VPNYNSGKCIQVIPSTSKITWFAAEVDCQSRAPTSGGHLYSVLNSFEQNYLAATVQGLGCSQYWIGGSDFQQNQTFQWTDHQPWMYTHWAPGEPQTGVAGGDCVAMMVDNRGNNWVTLPCDFTGCYVCESTPAIVSCPPGWQYNSQTAACYNMYTEPVFWADAEFACRITTSLGFTGHLISIHSAAENSFALSLINNLGWQSPPICNGVQGWYWIGFNETVSLGLTVYSWTDGTPWDFNSLINSMPADGAYCGGQVANNCADQTGPVAAGQWNGLSCGQQLKLPYICKIALPPFVGTQPPPTAAGTTLMMTTSV